MAATSSNLPLNWPTPSSTTHAISSHTHSAPHLQTSDALVLPSALHNTLVARPPRRIMLPEQGRALEVLSHAIEYLEDQMLFGPSTWSRREGDRTAIDMMKQRSRNIYSGLPLRRSLWQRIQQKFSDAARRHAQPTTAPAPASARVIPFPTS
jgi:hypothetical protein